jgi:hypothetical protein
VRRRDYSLGPGQNLAIPNKAAPHPEVSGTHSLVTLDTGLNTLNAVAVDTSYDVFVTDLLNDQVVELPGAALPPASRARRKSPARRRVTVRPLSPSPRRSPT